MSSRGPGRPPWARRSVPSPSGMASSRESPDSMSPRRSSQCYESAWGVVEHLEALGGAHHDVLDPRAELAFEVDARLDRERHALLEHGVVALDAVGLLVRLLTNAVAGAVDEPVAVSGLGDQRTPDGVHGLGGDPRTGVVEL